MNFGYTHKINLNHIFIFKYVMGHVGVHDDDKVASGSLYSMDIGRSESKLATSRFQDNLVGSIDSLKLLGNLQCSVR